MAHRSFRVIVTAKSFLWSRKPARSMCSEHYEYNVHKEIRRIYIFSHRLAIGHLALSLRAVSVCAVGESHDAADVAILWQGNWTGYQGISGANHGSIQASGASEEDLLQTHHLWRFAHHHRWRVGREWGRKAHPAWGKAFSKIRFQAHWCTSCWKLVSVKPSCIFVQASIVICNPFLPWERVGHLFRKMRTKGG